MNQTSVSTFIENALGFKFEVWPAIKIAVALGLFLYLGFAVMVVRQVDLMSRSLNGTFETPLKFFARLYLAAALLTFLMALFFL